MNKARVFQERRRKLRELLPNAVILLANGDVTHRNIESYTYAFRGSSHFLYFAAKAPAGSYLLLTPSEEILFTPEGSPKDILWHGSTPSRQELGAIVGVGKVLSVDELPNAIAALSKENFLSLPVSHAPTNSRLEALIGRAIDVDELDRKLVQAVVQLRLLHDSFAIQELRIAADLTTKAHLAGALAATPGATEWDVQAAMEAVCKREGCEVSFSPIVTLESEVLHGSATGRTLSQGQLLLVDFGAESLEGYAGDVTRVWPIGGRFSQTQAAIYDVVLQSQLKAIETVRPGVRYLDVQLAAMRSMVEGLIELKILRGSVDGLVEQGVSGLFFPHGIGHLLGLDVHDMEDLGDQAGYSQGRSRSTEPAFQFLRLDRDLEPGMLVTIEPGIYFISELLFTSRAKSDWSDSVLFDRLEQFSDVRGIRIEDEVLVTESGNEVLTRGVVKQRAAIEQLLQS